MRTAPPPDRRMLSRAAELRAARACAKGAKGAIVGAGLRTAGDAPPAAYLAWSAIGCRNAEKPVSMICTPMHSSRNADTRFATFVPSLPR